jgi:hypothetical protein
MAGRGELERLIRQLVGETVSVSLAQVVGPVPNPFQPTLSPLVRVLLQPGNAPAEVRLLTFGQGPGQGLFFPVVPGAEIVVVFPEGEPDSGIGIAGLSSGANIAPTATDGAGAVLMSALGVTLRSVTGIPSEAIVKGSLLTGGPPGAAPPFGGLSQWVTAAEAFMFATSTATTAPQVAAAAVAFMTAVGKAGPLPSPFAALLTASANTVTAGGPPFASLTNKVTD